jgi:hypothetical protein
MTITGSPDITVLDFQVTWDISGTLPVISLVNQSLGPNLPGCIWWIIATSPTSTPIHSGVSAMPDITGAWTTFVLTDPWPRPFGQIEWSGAPYVLTLYVQDSAMNQYSLTKSATICRPFGNTSLSKNPYGQANISLQVLCDQAAIYFQNQTVQNYQGITGVQLSSVLRVIYPIDPTYNLPTPFQITDFSSALVPISYNSDNYQFVAYSVYAYGFGNSTFVNVKYQQLATFGVLCNVDFAPLICEITRLDNSVRDGSCQDSADAQRRLNLIYPKLFLALMGQLQPLTGVPVADLIREIEEIGGFTCDCCNAVTGIIPSTSSAIGGYIFDIVPTCGDIHGTVTTSGNTIQFNLADTTYVFAMYPGSPPDTTAFTVIPALNGCTKTYYLSVDISQLMYDGLNTIKTNAGLVNLFNSIVASTGGAGQLIVDGSCIFSSTSTCDYTLGLVGIPATTTFAILTGIKIGSNNISLSFSFNQTNLGPLQTYLNGLGYGTFSVVNGGGGVVTITSTANSNDIQGLTYNISSTSYPASLSRNCTGFVPIPTNQAVQYMINYICAMNDTQVVTSQDYLVCYLDSTGTKQQITIPKGSTLEQLIVSLVTNNCTTITNLQSVSGVTCSSVKALFTANQNLITANDYFLATKGGGNCSQVGYLDAFTYMLTTGMTNSSVKTLFCQFVELCGAGLSCAPYNSVNVIVSYYNTACAPVVGIEYTLM